MRRAGHTLVEAIVSCALFSVFMLVALGLFTGMTRVVRKEQTPAEKMLEARLALWGSARRLRDCQALVRPSLRELIFQPTSALMLRDQIRGRTVELKVMDETLVEVYYSVFYDPFNPGEELPRKALRLCDARSFEVRGGGLAHPTRLDLRAVLPDGRLVRVVTNFREAI
jgi:hypothetical protein